MKPLIHVAVVFTIMLAAKTAASADGPATPESLHLKALLSRLSAAGQQRIRGLKTIQCDYRLDGTYDSEESPADAKPPAVKLALSGKLTIQLPKDPAQWELNNAPGAFHTFRLEPDAWPMLTVAYRGSWEAKQFKAFPIPGSRVICCDRTGFWLVSKDEKSAVKMSPEDVFAEIIPTVCCHYEACMVSIEDDEDALATKVKSASLGGRTCAMYRFKLPAKDKADAGIYAVWLDDATALPLREELDGGITTYSDLKSFGKGLFSPAKSEMTSPDTRHQVSDRMEIRYAPWGSRWFLTQEMRLRSSDGLCRITFSNWRRATVPDSFFRLPPGATRYAADHGAKTNNAPPAIRQKPIR
jgi:hypothetical protein